MRQLLQYRWLDLFCKLQWIMITFFDFMLFSYLQFVVGLGDKVSPTDIEEGMRVG